MHRGVDPALEQRFFQLMHEDPVSPKAGDWGISPDIAHRLNDLDLHIAANRTKLISHMPRLGSRQKATTSSENDAGHGVRQKSRAGVENWRGVCPASRTICSDKSCPLGLCDR